MTSGEISNLVDAFAYPLYLMNECFFWDKRSLQVIEVPLFAWEDEEEGLLKDNLLSRAIRDYHNNDPNLIAIPSLSLEERIDLLASFVEKEELLRHDEAKVLAGNLADVISASQNYAIKYYAKGLLRGINLEYILTDIKDQQIAERFKVHYFSSIHPRVLNWVASI
jgi:hypothetical protein